MSETPRVHRPLYRVFHLGPAGGIVRADVIEAADDADAIVRVRAASTDHASELWDRARFIARIEPQRNAVTPAPPLPHRAAAMGEPSAETLETPPPPRP